jgi:ornithine decarboxylase
VAGILDQVSIKFELKHFFLVYNYPVALKSIHRAFLSCLETAGTKQTTGAFYALSVSRLASQIQLWNSELTEIKPFYAVKCNPDPNLVTRLAKVGFGFDCASKKELEDIYPVAGGSTNIIYANPCKSERDLHFARKIGSPTTVVDSFEEVDKLSGAGYDGGALMRITVEDKTSLVSFSQKFGIVPEQTKALGDYALSRGIELKGVSFHVGSGCADPALYECAIGAAAAAATTLQGLGHQATTIDIGGGFYADNRDFQRKALFIRAALFGMRMQKPQFQFIAEPGRFFAEAAYDFFVQVIGKKPGKDGWRYTIDDSLYGQFSGILFDHARPQWVRVRGPDDKRRKTGAGVLFGRTCDSVDVVAKASAMEELEVGDWLWFPRMGAYTRATASEFNGFPHPEVLVNYSDEPSYSRLFSDLKYEFPQGVRYAEPVRAL